MADSDQRDAFHDQITTTIVQDFDRMFAPYVNALVEDGVKQASIDSIRSVAFKAFTEGITWHAVHAAMGATSYLSALRQVESMISVHTKIGQDIDRELMRRGIQDRRQ